MWLGITTYLSADTGGHISKTPFIVALAAYPAQAKLLVWQVAVPTSHDILFLILKLPEQPLFHFSDNLT